VPRMRDAGRARRGNDFIAERAMLLAGERELIAINCERDRQMDSVRTLDARIIKGDGLQIIGRKVGRRGRPRKLGARYAISPGLHARGRLRARDRAYNNDERDKSRAGAQGEEEGEAKGREGELRAKILQSRVAVSQYRAFKAPRQIPPLSSVTEWNINAILAR